MTRMTRTTLCGLTALLIALLTPFSSALADDHKLAALIIDGQNNHNWQATTPVLRDILESSGRFTVDVATSPAKGEDLAGFNPDFADYDVVVSNYNGNLWGEAMRKDFLKYVRSGGAYTVVHAANNPFGDWFEYNRIIGLGGWGGRDQDSGPYVRYRDGRVVCDHKPGRGGGHGRQHAFPVVHRKPDHPILKGLPTKWMHAEDELYDRLRGPATELTVLATAYSDPDTGGTGEHEPMLMTVRYGKGRIFHTVLGHDVKSLSCVGFQVTLNRGTEWAATGEVTLTEVPATFPGPSKPSLRRPKTSE